MHLWRISNHRDLSGEGGIRMPARWHNAGRPIVYAAESPAGALIEILVHLKSRIDKVPDSFTLLRIDAPEDIALEELSAELQGGWQEDHAQTREIGDGWLRSMRSPLLRVPSAIMPETWNVLINPLHPQAGAVRVEAAMEVRFDSRLL